MKQTKGLRSELSFKEIHYLRTLRERGECFGDALLERAYVLETGG